MSSDALVAPAVLAPAALVPLGVIIGAHGVRGELRVKLHNPSSDLLATQQVVWLRTGTGRDAQVEKHPVLTRRWHKELLLITIDRCTDRDVAEGMRGTELCVPRSALPVLEADEHYLVDLVGLRAQLPDGQEVGVVEAVIPYPTTNVLCVRSPQSVIEVPMLAPYVVETRVADGYVVVDHLGDLIPVPSPGARPRSA